MTTKTLQTELDCDFAQAIVETVREPLVVLDASLRILTANRSFYKIFHVNKKDTEKKLIYNLGNGQWDHPKLRYLLNDILPQKILLISSNLFYSYS